MKSKKSLTIGKTRSALYKTAKILGDINAVKRGTIGRRVTHRISGRISARLLSRLVRFISRALKFKLKTLLLTLSIFVFAKFSFSELSLANENKDQIIQQIISESIASYPGKCACPYQKTSNGSRCGKRSAYSKPGGYEPICFPSDVSEEMINSANTSSNKTLDYSPDFVGKVIVTDGDTIKKGMKTCSNCGATQKLNERPRASKGASQGTLICFKLAKSA